MYLKKILPFFLLNFFFVDTVLAQKSTSTITIKTLPGKGTSLVGSTNFKGASSLSHCLHPIADENGFYKVEFDVNEPILVHLVDYAIAKDNFYFLVEKNHDYVISKHDINPVHRLKDDSLFIKEFDVLNQIHSLYSIDRSPELSLDDINSFEKELRKSIGALSYKKGSTMFSVDEMINLYYAFDKPAKTEVEFFNICDSNFIIRNLLLDSAINRNLISSPFYNYFKKYFYLRKLKDVLSIKPLPNTQFTQNTLDRIENTNKEFETLFFNDSYIEVNSFYLLIRDYLHKKLFNESKYRTISDEMFDFVLNSNQFSQKVKDMFLASMLNFDLQMTNKVKGFKKQLDKFYESCKTPLYKSLLQKEINTTYSLLNDDVLSNTFLLNEQNQSVNLKEVIKKHKGKYIYIDVWYAGYPNSRDLLPKALELEETVKNKDFVVLFFLSQIPENQWKQEANLHKIKGQNSFCLKKGYDSKFAKSLGITYLPRYVIIDKEGKLINANATWPDDMLGKKYYEE